MDPPIRLAGVLVDGSALGDRVAIRYVGVNREGELRSGLTPASASDFCRWAADVRRWQWCQVVRAGVLVGEVVTGSTGRRSWWAEFPSDQHLPPTPPPASSRRRAAADQTGEGTSRRSSRELASTVSFDTRTASGSEASSARSSARSGARRSSTSMLRA